MKGLNSTAMAILIGCMLALASPAGRAADDVIDCSAGCLIMTCSDAGVCTVWECNSQGCQAIGVFTRLARSEQMRVSRTVGSGGAQIAPTSGAKVCDYEREPCAIKVCERGECEVSVFDGTAFVPAAVIDDIDSIVDRAHRKLSEDRLER